MKNKISAIAIATMVLSPLVVAQSGVVDHLTQRQLVDKVRQLKQVAASNNGSASVKIADYPNHFAMLSYRNKTGGGEVHERFADLFYVVQGRAMLITGASVVDPITVSPGEIRGSAVTPGKEQLLQKGDFVHIPAHVPHQLVLSSRDSFIYFVIKVQEE